MNRKIERPGGQHVRTVGSHRRYQVTDNRPDGTEGTVSTAVAQHPGDIPTGTLRKIERDLGPAFGEGWFR